MIFPVIQLGGLCMLAQLLVTHKINVSLAHPPDQVTAPISGTAISTTSPGNPVIATTTTIPTFTPATITIHNTAAITSTATIQVVFLVFFSWFFM